MNTDHSKSISVFAPAKINLYLHVTGRLDNGYHALDSLIAFADIGDDIVIRPSEGFSFKIDGPFGRAFSAKEKDFSPNSSNILVKAVWALAREARKIPNFEITLTKNLPMGAGIGGGSSDAASILWALCEMWDVPKNAAFLPGLMMKLGADVPVCFGCQSAQVQGAGEIINPAPDFAEVPLLLIYPGKPCATQSVFQHFGGKFDPQPELPKRFKNTDELVAFLKTTRNSLSLAASDHVPEIENVLNTLNADQNCALARMTGSGASCFGLYSDIELAEKAAAEIAEDNPDWWVKTGWLGRPERY